jgi:hypothetical protein
MIIYVDIYTFDEIEGGDRSSSSGIDDCVQLIYHLCPSTDRVNGEAVFIVETWLSSGL